MNTALADEAPSSVQALTNEYELSLSKIGDLNTKPYYALVRLAHHSSVTPLASLPSIQDGEWVYYLIPSAVDLPSYLESSTLLVGAARGEAFIPDETNDWTMPAEPDGSKIVKELMRYHWDVYHAHRHDEATELLKRHSGDSHYYASQKPIDEIKPMMVDGFMLDRGVSVIYGPMDEFKTTFATDLAARVSVGAEWRGHAVKARPVIWYALEGADEIHARLRALQRRLQGGHTPWGNHDLPFTVRERIPTDPCTWRREIEELIKFWAGIVEARAQTNDFPGDVEAYPSDTLEPLIVIDQLSLALDGEDEKGAKAAAFIRRCLDLLIENNELAKEDDPNFPTWPVASHVLLLHHQTKTGDDIAGHRAITSDTQALYRIRRFGKLGDIDRPKVAELRPMRTKGMPLPPPMRFEVEVVQVPDTQQSTTILKDIAPALPLDLMPAIEALREFEADAEISGKELNECLDAVIAGKDGAAKRKARQRARERLEGAGVLEPVTDDVGNVRFYHFHDAGTSQ